MSNAAKTESYRVAMALAKGTPIEREFLTPAELREVFHALVLAVGPDAAHAELALIDGSEAIARFPRLSNEFVRILGGPSLRKADFAFLPDRGSFVWGADPDRFRTLLRRDLRRYWLTAPVVALVAGVSWWGGTSLPYVQSMAQLLAIASSLFFAVFVTFGLGQVVRPEVADRLFKTGVLQEGLDADRYCVRLAIGGFILALASVAWGSVGPVIGGVLPNPARQLVEAGMGLVLVSFAALLVLLAMLATVDYLLNRSTDLVLKQSALRAFANDQRNPQGDASSPAHSVDDNARV